VKISAVKVSFVVFISLNLLLETLKIMGLICETAKTVCEIANTTYNKLLFDKLSDSAL